jgi:hypothetical protein
MSNPDKQLVNRLGYGAWAENVIVNFIEDWSETMVLNDGNMRIENDQYTVNAVFKDGHLDITVRAYVEHEGWQCLEQSIKLK